MMDIMYTIPSDETIGTCTITDKTIEGEGEPELTYRDMAVTETPRANQSRRRFLRKHDDGEIA